MSLLRPDHLSGVTGISDSDILIAEINPDSSSRQVVKITKEALGLSSSSGGGGFGVNFNNFTGGLNIEVSGDSNLINIHTPTHISGEAYTFNHSGVIGTGELVSFSVDDSGHVGVNTTGSNYNFHVVGSTCLEGGNLNLNYNATPKSDPHQTGRVWISGSHHLMISSG
jgi:hypothetical protein